MRNGAARAQVDRLRALFARLDASETDSELLAHWAAYLCVLVSGFIEVAVQSIYSDYVSKRANERVSRLFAQLLKLQNPKMGKLIELAGSFDPTWGSDLQAKTDGELKDAVDSIVANRNNIAHGRPVDITLVRVREYFQKTVKVVELIEKQCENA